MSPVRSSFLDLLRSCCALLVMFTHIRCAVFVAYADLAAPAGVAMKSFIFLGLFGQAPVITFFVLSGYLVGGSLMRAELKPWTPIDYMIKRLLRLWIVLLPAFALLALLPCSLRESGNTSLWVLLKNVCFLQTIEAPAYAGDFPLWSLANEFWYYVLFLGGWIAWKAEGRPRWVSLAMLGGLLAWLPFTISCTMLHWLLGVAVAGAPQVKRLPTLSFVALALSFCASRLWMSGYTVDLFVALSVAYAIHCVEDSSVACAFLRRTAAFWQFLASFSFSLYVLHVPVMHFLLENVFRHTDRVQPSASGFTLFALTLGLTMLSAWLFSLGTERYTLSLRRRLFGLLSRLPRLGFLGAKTD